MNQENKKILDAHFVEYYNYYKVVAKQYFKEQHLQEDFVHELYFEFLKCSDETMLKFSGKLKLLSFSIRKRLASLSLKTNRAKKGQVGKTSPLYDCGDKMLDIDKLQIEQEEIELFDIDEEKIEIIKGAVWTSVERVRKDGIKAPNKYYEIATFSASQNESIRSIARRTGLSRPKITDICDLGAIRLKQLIQ